MSDKPVFFWIDWKLWFVGVGVDLFDGPRKEIAFHVGPFHLSIVFHVLRTPDL